MTACKCLSEVNNSHIICPISKKPVKTSFNISSVSVIANNCYFADAIATASMTFDNIEDLKKWAIRLKIKSNSELLFIIYIKNMEKALFI